MAQLPAELYPFCAPLPFPMAEYLFARFKRRNPYSDSEALNHFLQKIQVKCQNIYSHMRHHLYLERDAEERNKFFSRWLLEAIKEESPKKTKVHHQTSRGWYISNLLRGDSKEDYRPTYDSAAALLITRAIDRGERKWYPPEISREEEAWWCIVQEHPEQNARACPISLLPELPPATLCWTPCWPGATWNAQWENIEDQGAIRWAGVVPEGHPTKYTLTAEDLEIWDPIVAATLLPGDEKIFSQALKLALLRLSKTRIQPFQQGSNIDSFYNKAVLLPSFISNEIAEKK
jgi:hypothetical protein